MKKLLLMTLLVVTAALGQQQGNAPQGGAPKAGPPKSQAKVLSNSEFDALLENPDQVLIVDVRRPDEVSSNGGFPVYLSIQLGQLQKSLAWIPKDRTIITVSNHAARGGQAADILTKAGFKVAGTIGAQTYEQAGGTITKIAVPPPHATAPAGDKGGF
jgi:rhodanese-related sulfurtransferase